jgi:hypothetical protein
MQPLSSENWRVRNYWGFWIRRNSSNTKQIEHGAFRRSHGISMAQHFRAISEILHFLKRAVSAVEENNNDTGP